MAAPKVQPRSTTLMLPTTGLFWNWDLISKKLLPNGEDVTGTLLPFAVTMIPKLDPGDKNATGKLINILEDEAAFGTMNCNFTVTLVAPGILSLSEMMNVGAATSPFSAYTANADAQSNATVVGGDIEVERVNDTAGPNLPAPNVVLKSMIKL